jgi:4-amino-4-deoxy-L-arabinose transferase-like glycosyltransferase
VNQPGIKLPGETRQVDASRPVATIMIQVPTSTTPAGVPAVSAEEQRMPLTSLGLLHWTLLAVLLVAAVASRLVNVGLYSGSYPEGVRAAQLLLLSLGFRPFRDIFSDQGPWLLDLLHPGVVLFGDNLVGVRTVVIAASLLGLLGAYAVVRQLGGRAAALSTVALLVLSPTYLRFSRLAVAELVAITPALFALAAAARFAHTGRRRWLVASGVLYGVSLLAKPIAFGVGPALALAIFWHRDRWRALAILVVSSAVTVLVGTLVVGLPDIVRQILIFRLQSRAVEGWSLAANLARAREHLAEEGLPLYLLAALGLALALRRRRTWPLALWLVVSFATIAVHSPLHAKHFTLATVPAALLGGLPVQALLDAASRLRRGLPTVVPAAMAGVIGLVYLASLPGVLARDQRLLVSTDLFDNDASAPWYGDAIATLARTTPPGSFVVTDHAYLAFAAGRPLPPFLAEASATRVRAGTLTDEQAIENSQRFDTRAVLLWADKLVDLKRYRAWVQREFLLAKVWAAEDDARPELWLPRDADPAIHRAALRTGLHPGPAASLDGRLRIVHLSLDRTEAAPGDLVSATLEWEAVESGPSDLMVDLILRSSDGQTADDEREPLLGGRTTLEPGWWQFWVGAVRVPTRATPGDYQVVVQLRDRSNRRLGEDAVVGTVRVGSSRSGVPSATAGR